MMGVRKLFMGVFSVVCEWGDRDRNSNWGKDEMGEISYVILMVFFFCERLRKKLERGNFLYGALLCLPPEC